MATKARLFDLTTYTAPDECWHVVELARLVNQYCMRSARRCFRKYVYSIAVSIIPPSLVDGSVLCAPELETRDGPFEWRLAMYSAAAEYVEQLTRN